MGTLLIDSNRLILEKTYGNAGNIQPGEIKNPDYDDILDDLAGVVFKNRGNVVMLPTERMPGKTGVAATFRY